MNATTAHPTSPASEPAATLAAVPRAIWVALGVLSLATAAMGGAFVMQAVSEPAPAVPVALASPAAMPDTIPASPLASGLAARGVATPQAIPQAPFDAPEHAQAPVKAPPPPVAKAPRPAPRPVVQQATGSATHAAPVAAAAPVAVAEAAPRPAPMPVESRPVAICYSCGTVQHVQEVQEKGAGTGIGAVGGAVVGGLLGNQVGGGNGKKVMTVLGAVGGGLAGHEAEKRVRAVAAYDVQVRMEDGSVRTVRRAEPVAVGTRVTVEGNTLQVGGRPSTQPAPARPMYTVQPAVVSGS